MQNLVYGLCSLCNNEVTNQQRSFSSICSQILRSVGSKKNHIQMQNWKACHNEGMYIQIMITHHISVLSLVILESLDYGKFQVLLGSNHFLHLGLFVSYPRPWFVGFCTIPTCTTVPCIAKYTIVANCDNEYTCKSMTLQANDLPAK